MDVAHVALWVSDVDRAIEFYEALGLERTWSFEMDGVENIYLGDEHGELQLKHDPDRTTPIAPGRADVDHVALTVDDLDATVEQAVEAGGTVVTDPHRRGGRRLRRLRRGPRGVHTGVHRVAVAGRGSAGC